MVESGKRKKKPMRVFLLTFTSGITSAVCLSVLSWSVPVGLGHSTDKILIKTECRLSLLLLPWGQRPLPFSPASLWLAAGEECEFQSFVPTFIVIFLSGLLK